MITVVRDNFTDAVKNSKIPVLTYFWADWCGPCKMLAPVLADLDNELAGKLVIAKINTDDDVALARDNDILSIPTMILFVDGKEKFVMSGAKSKPMLLKELKKHINL